MRLKRLVCRGFKSFADRTEFDFDQNLTGIIGPNGCGKSNVVDALKWVLGDQAPRSLRGAEMTDVIFKGAEGREAMGMADVRVVFEDPQGRLDGQTEVEIGRTLTRDKESAYLLNGQTVRLKDIKDVLLDTGLGVSSYSVMEQGRIDAVLSANPESRRAIFEEAAGISKFKIQKKESLRKLDRTEQNLARVQDLLEERGRRLRSLKIQAGRARRHRELTVRIGDLKAALAVLAGRELRARQAIEGQRLAGLQARLDQLDRTLAAAQGKVVAADEEIATCQGALESAQEQVHRDQGRLESARHRAAAQEQRASELREDLSAGLQRAEQLRAQHEDRGTALEVARGNLVAREEDLVRFSDQTEQAELEHGVLVKNWRELQVVREEVRTLVLDHLHAQTRARNGAHDQEAALRSLAARSRRIDERVAGLVKELGTLAAEETALGVAACEQRELLQELSAREVAALADLEAADAAAADLGRQEAAIGKELSEVLGRKKALEDMEAHHEGLDEGPRFLLGQRPPGLLGRLVDLLEVDLEYSTALEAALGSYVQALVVDTRGHAEALLALLEREHKGRVLLLVEAEFATTQDGPSPLALPAGASFLLDLVRCVPGPGDRIARSRRLLSWLLRGVALVDTLESAPADRADLCFVTRAGALMCGPRMAGGDGAAGVGLVQRRSRIRQLEVGQRAVEARLSALATGQDRAKGRVEKIKGEVRELGETLRRARRELQEIEAQVARNVARAGDLRREGEVLELEEHEVRGQRAHALAVLGRQLLQVHLLQRLQRREGERERRLDRELEEAHRRSDSAAVQLQELRLQQVRCRSDRDGIRDGTRVHEEALRELDRSLHDLEERNEGARAGAAAAQQTGQRALDEAGHTEQELAVSRSGREQTQDAVATAKDRRAALVEDLKDSQRERNDSQDQVGTLRMSLQETGHKFQLLEERLREDTAFELRRCLGEVGGLGLVTREWIGPTAPLDLVSFLSGPPLPPAWVERTLGLTRLWEAEDFDPKESQTEVKVLESKIQRLGAVNLDAVEELESEEGSFVSLEQEVDDLREARRALFETLRRLEEESRTLFLATFRAARENFLGIFRKLFQGGRADMYLVDEEDALDSGIEIMARPPGKELQSISLLSGGERSMTALAILFAVFKVKPSPFCILDEVDAALDEANVERFLRVLRDFVGKTQFCIVTHHKRTMAECQALYGITMQKRGVSNRIAVSLDEVEEVTGGEVSGVAERNGGERGGADRGSVRGPWLGR